METQLVVFFVTSMFYFVSLYFYYIRNARYRLTQSTTLTLSFFFIIVAHIFELMKIYIQSISFTGEFIADICYAIGFYLLYEAHDHYSLKQPQSMVKYLILFLLAFIIGSRFWALVDPLGTNPIFETLGTGLSLVIILTICYLRPFVYYTIETDIISHYFDPDTTTRFYRIARMTGFLGLLIGMFLLFNFDFVQISPFLTYSIVNVLVLFIILGYSISPVRDTTFPIGLNWLGIISDNGTILFSFVQTTHQHKADELPTRISERMNDSYHAINQLVSDALQQNVSIKRLQGWNFSIHQISLDKGNMLVITENLMKNIDIYDYNKFLQLLKDQPNVIREFNDFKNETKILKDQINFGDFVEVVVD